MTNTTATQSNTQSTQSTAAETTITLKGPRRTRRLTFRRALNYAKKHTPHFTDRTEKFMRAMCFNHSGKMSGVPSVSTSVLMNPYCKKRIESDCENLICKYCYAGILARIRAALAKKLARNTEFFTGEMIPFDEIPVLPDDVEIFRLEAFGDLINVIQAINYMRFVTVNTHVFFALWTKNPWIIEGALKGIKKPRNMNIIYSAPFIDMSEEDAARIFERYPFIDKIFIVHSKKCITRKDIKIKINCGARSCDLCRRCYSKRTGKFVHELLK